MQLPPVNMALRCALGLQAGHEALDLSQLLAMPNVLPWQ